MKKSIFTIIFLLSLIIAHAHVKLDYPQGGESFYPGQEITIEWTELVQHDTENFDLYFSSDGGVSWEALQLDIPPVNRSYDWTVPEDMTDEARIRIIQDNTGPDYQDESSNFTIADPTGITSLSEQASFRIYPNPARGHFYFDSGIPFEGSELHIISTSGKLMAIHPLKNEISGNTRQEIQLEGLKPGMYFILLKSANDARLEKLLVY